MAKHPTWLISLGTIALLLSAFMVRGALAVTPDEYLYSTSQTSSAAITNSANSIDSSFNDTVATASGPFGDGPANHWTFTAIQNTSLTSIIGVAAEIRFLQAGWANDTFAFEVFDGNTWTRLATYNPANPPPSVLTTLKYDVSAVLDTVAKVNAAQLRLIGVSRSGARDTMTLSLDGVRLGAQSSTGPTPTATPAFTPTATPTAAPVGGTTDITPNNAQNANPGATASYTHTVTQLGQAFDFKNITAVSSLGWAVILYGSDGMTPLSDHNGDGVPDTDRLNSGQTTTIVVKVIVPASTLAGVQDIISVTASSGRNPIPGNSDSATDTTTVNGIVSLTLSTSSADFGFFSPGGEIDPAVSGISSSVDGLGAYYMKQASDNQGAVRVTVSSNGAWTGSCWAGENAGDASTIRVGDGEFEWSMAGLGSWTPFDTSAQLPPYDNSCFTNRPLGANTYGYDLRLRVGWTDDPGTFSSAVTFAVTQ